MREENIFVTVFSGQDITILSTLNLHFPLIKLGSNRLAISMMKAVSVGAILTL
jgi:hypothetical protein